MIYKMNIGMLIHKIVSFKLIRNQAKMKMMTVMMKMIFLWKILTILA